MSYSLFYAKLAVPRDLVLSMLKASECCLSCVDRKKGWEKYDMYPWYVPGSGIFTH